VFVSFLGHPDATVRVEAIRGLRGFDDERVIELFEEAIADADPRVHEAALRAFCALVDRATLRTLERLYEKAEGPDRATILSAPPAEKWKLMEPLYRRALSDPSPEPRVALMRLLRYRYYPDPEMLRPYFVAGAVDAEPEVRRQAGGGLAALPAGSLDVLARLVTDEEASVRAEVLEGLIGRERRDAKDLVRGAVGDAEPSVRLLAVEGLVRLMSTKEAEPLLLPLARDSSPEVRALAVRKLAWRARKGTATEAARAALQDPVPEVRAAGIDTLWNVKSKGWLETVAALLEDVSPVVRRAAVAVIRYETPSAKVLPHLLKALDDPDPGIRRDAAMSFSASTKPTAELVAKLKALRQGDPDFQVRAFAESSLRVMNVIPGGPSVLLPGSREGSLPQDVLPLYVFPGSLPDGLAGPPNLAMLGRYEAVEPSKVPEVLRELVFRQDEEGEIHYTSWLGEIAAVVTRRFEPDPEFPGVRSLSYWSAGDGVYRIVSWSRDKTAQTRGVSSFALSDDGQTLTFTQIGETTMKSNPTVESLRQTITDEKKLAKTLQMMGLKAGPTTTYYSHSYVYRRSDR
jgi:HEAT repeat protein